MLGAVAMAAPFTKSAVMFAATFNYNSTIRCLTCGTDRSHAR
jgi:hypothetical protein